MQIVSSRPQQQLYVRHVHPAGIGPLRSEHGGCRGQPRWYEEPALRHVEKDVLIPKLMREKARQRCSEKVQDFTHCCQESGFLMVLKCREENAALKGCLISHYKDPHLFEECKQEYLQEREEYRKTGIPAKNRREKIGTSM
ncbi:COXM1 protein, partial [Polypterus senegalus]